MAEDPNNPFWFPQELQLKDASDVIINPATKEKQDEQIVLLQDIADGIPDVPLTGSAPNSASVSSASTVIVASNASRKGLSLINNGSRDCFIGIGTAALLNKGILLRANGGYWIMDRYTFTTQAINGIVTVSTTTILIQEFT